MFGRRGCVLVLSVAAGIGKARSRHGHEKSDSAIVAVKPAKGATPKLFSFAQEPFEIDGLVKVLSGLKPNRIHEPRRREVCP